LEPEEVTRYPFVMSGGNLSMSGSCFPGTRRLGKLWPSDAQPQHQSLADSTSVVLEQDQLSHAIQSAKMGRSNREYLANLGGVIPEAGRTVFDQVVGRSLDFVLNRGLLSDDPNLTYVFREEAEYKPMMLGVELKVGHSSLPAPAFQCFLFPCSVWPASNGPCAGCGHYLYRGIKTVMHGINRGKQNFLLGAGLHNGRAFDPALDCEWFRVLPQAWGAFSPNGRTVVLTRPCLDPVYFENERHARVLKSESRPLRYYDDRHPNFLSSLGSAYKNAACKNLVSPYE
jgi:hypothetical protein